MQRGYTKLFNQIITSTIWREKDQTRVLWITMLALSDRSGELSASVPGLADVARLSIEDTRDALAVLEAPDPDSRTKKLEGRRIVPIEGGWLIVNYADFRRLLSIEERLEYKRIKEQERRDRIKSGVDNRGQNGKNVSARAQRDTIADADAVQHKAIKSTPIVPLKGDEFEIFWKAYPRKEGKRTALSAWKRAKIPLETALSAIAKQKASPKWHENNGQFIPQPATWLNQGRWEDEPQMELKSEPKYKDITGSYKES